MIRVNKILEEEMHCLPMYPRKGTVLGDYDFDELLIPQWLRALQNNHQCGKKNIKAVIKLFKHFHTTIL